MYTLQFDGLFRKIPETLNGKQAPVLSGKKAGLMSYGWLIYSGDQVIATGHGVFAHANQATSNAAEYLALLEGLEALRDLGVRQEPVTIRGDAKSVIDQMCGQSSVNSGSVLPLYNRAQRLSRWFERLTWVWTPRRKNKAADWLTRKAIKHVCQDQSNYQAAINAIQQRKNKRKIRFLPLLDLRIYNPSKNMLGDHIGSWIS